MIPFTNPARPGEQQDEGHVVVLHDQGEAYQHPISYLLVLGRCPETKSFY